VTALATHATLDERVDSWLAAEPAGLTDPYGLFEDIRRAGRVYEHPQGVFLTSYEDVRSVIRDPVRFSRRAASHGSRALDLRAGLDDAHRRIFDEVSEYEASFISRTDGERHERLRGIAHRAFAPRRIAAMEETIQSYVDELIGVELDRDPPDFMTLAYGLPLWVVCNLLGAPPEDRQMIHGWSVKIGRNHGVVIPERLRDAADAHRSFRAYVAEIVERHRRSPGSSGELVSALLDAEQGDRLTEEELAAMFVVLLFAGHETTTNLIGGGLRELLLRPEVWNALVADPSLVPAAVEELLRFVSPVQFVFRFAVEDVEIGGTTIPAGTTVFPLLPAANRDPEVFVDPDRLDIHRHDTGQHLALGFGPFFCLGASLARLEARLAYTTVLTRYPRLALVDDEVEWAGSAMLRRLARLGVSLDPVSLDPVSLDPVSLDPVSHRTEEV
jgi:cytochrome P450